MISRLHGIKRLFAIAAALLLVTGCVILPLPEHGGWGESISPDAIDKLVPGTTSRAEVLLALGQSSMELLDDHAYVYRWERNVGIFAMYGGDTGGIPVPRQLCLEFDNNGILSRKEFFQPWAYSLSITPPPCPATSSLNQTDVDKK